MNQRNKYTLGFAGIVLSGTLAFGAIASAAGPEDGGRHLPKLTVEERCVKAEKVADRATEIQSMIAERTTVLQERRTEAEAAGNSQLVELLDRRLARMDKIANNITGRQAKLQTWVDENCVVG